MPNQKTQSIVDEIVKAIEQGIARKKILANVGAKWRISSRTFDRHWKTANEQHTQKQQAIKAALVEVDKQAAIEQRKRDIMTADERKEYLSKIIRGEIKVPYTEVRWDRNQLKYVTVQLEELAGHTARIQAITELNRMEGDHAPTKNEHTGKDGKPLFSEIKRTVVFENYGQRNGYENGHGNGQGNGVEIKPSMQ